MRTAPEPDLPREHLPTDSIVCHFGDAGDCAYIVEAGSVAVISEGGRLIATLRAGELFGEVALLDAKPRTATVRTLEPTTLLRVERVHVQELLKKTDPVIRYLLELLLERFRAHRGEPALPPTPGNRSPLRNETLATRTLALTQDLAHALTKGQLELAYQPLIDVAQRNLIGFEALIRWRHPVLGSILPTKLITLAESTGLIYPLGAWVIQHALSDWPALRALCKADKGGPFIHVNLSATELANPHVVDMIREKLTQAQVDPRELKIELTETSVIDDQKPVVEVLNKLATLGVGIALDDFGTGQANLNYLKTLPITCLKIDQSFVLEMATSPRCAEIVQSTVDLAHSMGLMVIGEGVENEAIADRLTAMGCRIAQGYHYARPMPAKDVPAWLRDARKLGRIA